MRALAIAATGMNAQQTNIEVIANNIANINTTAFKRARAEFTRSALSGRAHRGRARPRRSEPIPEGAQVGLGTRTAAVRNLHIQGALTNTGNKLDLALQRPRLVPGRNAAANNSTREPAAFNKSATGQLVTSDGYTVQPGDDDSGQCDRGRNQ